MMPSGETSTANQLADVKWALLFGNFAIGCGVMVVAGTLNEISHALSVSVSTAAQLIAVGAVVICVGGPLLAGVVAGWDRRRLLGFSLLWYGAGHLACGLSTDYTVLLFLRASTLLAAAIFTPQAAATVGFIAPAQRAYAITFIFLGWSLATVVGTPLSAWIGASLGWPSAFYLVAMLSGLAGIWVYATVPRGVRLPALSRKDWMSGLGSLGLMALVAVTALQSTAQFTLFSYFAPVFRQELGASANELSLMFAWFGLLGLVGSFAMSQFIARVGTARAVNCALMLVGISLLLWPLASTLPWLAVVLAPWALGSFAVNSGQQARLTQAAPHLAPALMALNNSAIYLGQAIGAAGGGIVVARSGYGMLSWLAAGWMLAAILLSIRLSADPPQRPARQKS